VRGTIEIQLEQLLSDRDMMAYALAKQVGLDQSMIAKFRDNEAKAVRLDVLERICNALGCEPGELLVKKAVKKNKN
jgi:putative transcriptional regulator